MPSRTGALGARALFLAATAAASAGAPAPTYLVHRLSAEHARPAAWTRTKCGSPSKSPQSDIITSWGAQVTPDSVVEGFGYPRPQLTRDEATSTYTSLNGLWEFSLANGHIDTTTGAGTFDDPLPFGATLNQTILVPFPYESCLSGAFAWPAYSKFLFYRLLFDAPAGAARGLNTVLHFGAVDWNASVCVNGAFVTNHVGGYDAFSADVTPFLKPTSNELVLAVFDPSDQGVQPHGKQRISAIPNPSGDTYTPSSGVWQTAWLECVPALHISSLRLRADTRRLFITVSTPPGAGPALVSGAASFGGAQVATFAGAAFAEIVVEIPAPHLWSMDAPNLYDLVVNVTGPSTGVTDSVGSYFGMREVSLMQYTLPKSSAIGSRPAINGNFSFLAGWLDQSWWSDGEYTAPSDDALAFDVQAVKTFGLNSVRLHQKVNPERWYFAADKLGVAILQDAVQKYGGASNATTAERETGMARRSAGADHPRNSKRATSCC
jgi:beta-galactosidase/beta-glucuronidase